MPGLMSAGTIAGQGKAAAATGGASMHVGSTHCSLEKATIYGGCSQAEKPPVTARLATSRCSAQELIGCVIAVGLTARNCTATDVHTGCLAGGVILSNLLCADAGYVDATGQALVGKRG